MTVDDALKYEYFGCAEEALAALKAEVERLRAENAELRSARDGWKDAAKAGLSNIAGKAAKLIAQNEALKKQQAWFELRDRAIRETLVRNGSLDRSELAEWELDNPKPEEGT